MKNYCSIQRNYVLILVHSTQHPVFCSHNSLKINNQRTHKRYQYLKCQTQPINNLFWIQNSSNHLILLFQALNYTIPYNYHTLQHLNHHTDDANARYTCQKVIICTFLSTTHRSEKINNKGISKSYRCVSISRVHTSSRFECFSYSYYCC